MLLLIFSAQTGPRLLYILEEIFRYRFAIPYRLTADLAEYRDWQGPRLNYSSAPGGGTEIWIPACSFLFGSGTSSPSPEVTRVGQTPALFPVEIPQTGDFPFDLFAMGFFLLSRYEEYSPALRDEHGRFPSSASLSHKEGFLEIPVWDIWMDRLAEKLRQVFPELSPARPGFSFLPTFDVDQIWAYRHKPVLRQWGGMARDLFAARFRLVLQRLAVLSTQYERHT